MKLVKKKNNNRIVVENTLCEYISKFVVKILINNKKKFWKNQR